MDSDLPDLVVGLAGCLPGVYDPEFGGVGLPDQKARLTFIPRIVNTRIRWVWVARRIRTQLVPGVAGGFWSCRSWVPGVDYPELPVLGCPACSSPDLVDSGCPECSFRD